MVWVASLDSIKSFALVCNSVLRGDSTSETENLIVVELGMREATLIRMNLPSAVSPHVQL